MSLGERSEGDRSLESGERAEGAEAVLWDVSRAIAGGNELDSSQVTEAPRVKRESNGQSKKRGYLAIALRPLKRTVEFTFGLTGKKDAPSHAPATSLRLQLDELIRFLTDLRRERLTPRSGDA